MAVSLVDIGRIANDGTGDDLREAIHFIVTEFDQQALVEQFIRGANFVLGCWGTLQ